MKRVIVAVLLLGILACNNASQEVKEAKSNSDNQQVQAVNPPALENLTTAHQLSKFEQKELVAFDIALYFRGRLRLEGTIFSRTNSTAVLVAKADGTELLFDGEEVYVMPDSAEQSGARFDALTWSYFALAPFKFKDEGTHWTANGLLPLDSGHAAYPSLKLTFGDNVGDAPDDWYIIFQDEKTDLLKAMAYIVTFGDTPQAEAEKSPHAITYSAYQIVSGIPFATKWGFHNWNAKEGLGVQLGEASISNIRFMEEPDSLFTKKSNAVMVPLQ